MSRTKKDTREAKRKDWYWRGLGRRVKEETKERRHTFKKLSEKPPARVLKLMGGDPWIYD